MENIERIVYINLDHRHDRREEVESELRDYDVPQEKIRRFSAIKYDPGFIGCTMSHIAVLEEAIRDNVKNILILEDDFQFVVSKKDFDDSLHYFFHDFHLDKPCMEPTAPGARPKGRWDVIMFNYNTNNPENKVEDYRGDSKIGYIRFAQTTCAYLVNGHYMQKLLDNFKEGLHYSLTTMQHWNYSIDIYWKHLQCKDEWFYFKQRIGKQRISFSDIGNKISYLDC